MAPGGANGGVADHVVELGPGDYLAWDPTVPHDVENLGPGEGRMLVLYPRSGRSTPGSGAATRGAAADDGH